MKTNETFIILEPMQDQCDMCMRRYKLSEARCPRCKEPNPEYHPRLFNGLSKRMGLTEVNI